MSIEKIPTEIIQLFSSKQAWEYQLIPYKTEGNTLFCYAIEGKDYTETSIEIEVLSGYRIICNAIAEQEISKNLQLYYRKTNVLKKSGNAIDNITAGQDFLMQLIEEAFDCYVSDIHIECYDERCRIRFRIDGKLIERYVVERRNYASLINQIKILSRLDISEKRLPQDGRILFNRHEKKFDVRVSSLPTIYGEKIVLRLLTRHVELLELVRLGFNEKQLNDYENAISKPYGLILICGPTGSGKSTTLYATLRKLNKECDNILTIEDPVEYTLEGINQVQLKEEIGLTFASALRTFLRQDPDIIMLGEIRDQETAQMAIRSSLTGHLIFSTIHTNTAWGSITRLIDMGIPSYFIANTLVMCVAQRLVRLLCPHCKQKAAATSDVKKMLPGNNNEYHYVATGCEKCYYTGYSGRKAIYEVIPIDNELAQKIREGEQDVDAILRNRNIITLHQAGLDMVLAGETSIEEISI
ncbi:GspE/PulE family protein [Xiashengella succiniciproducens]|uniref:GspE/PulE family protein n=1 Tax=Xiashengella succiniciproducens TaxID=2949635 RepID=A0A9J6ZSD1_9BACT|nr:GspE/PulE family protein [Alkaliflexus sp. Ai-910]URW80623.1 GspE/PulE family protein [Alkaliflexus sp. Ai-910]